MKLFYLLKLKSAVSNEYHTSAQHKYDRSDGCEFLDETVHMHEEFPA